MKTKFQALVEVQTKDVNALFRQVSHTLTCEGIPSASLRLHFVQHDFTGEPAFSRLAETLVTYITQYCFSAKRRAGLNELDRNRTFMRARKLFRTDPKSGQVGELLSYLFIEAVLQAPQVLKKMVISTNTDEERKGSDGVHMRWDEKDDVLEVIFAESKLWGTFSAALADAFVSMHKFHAGRIKSHEIDCVSSYFQELDPELQDIVDSYISGKLLAQSREVHACLIGFDWNEYNCLDDDRRKDFVVEFEERYKAWAKTTMLKLLEPKLKAFQHKHLTFDFIFIPFKNVAEFRKLFLGAL